MFEIYPLQLLQSPFLENVLQNSGGKVDLAEVIISHHLCVNISHKRKGECMYIQRTRPFQSFGHFELVRCGDVGALCPRTDWKCIE